MIEPKDNLQYSNYTGLLAELEEDDEKLDQTRILSTLHKYPSFQLFNKKNLRTLSSQILNSRDPDAEKILDKVMNNLKSLGPTRYLRTVNHSFPVELKKLRFEYPNFVEVIDYLETYWWLAHKKGEYVLRFPPLLLSGAPGIGKTRFSKAVAKILGGGFYSINVSALQTGSELAGSSSFWSNATPGVVFNALVNEYFGNPLIFLDEIEKTTIHREDPLAALYVLLEPSSSKNFQDQCYNIPLDASNVLYIAACNDPNFIAPPLRTRFREFYISISRAQTLQIARNIVEETTRELMPASDGISFTEDAITALANMSPRKIKIAVTEAIGRALSENTAIISSIRINNSHVRNFGFLP